MDSETRQCQNCKSLFTIEPEDFGFYEKIKVPPPTWCSRCRLMRRMVFRNERFLYKRTSDFSDKEIFLMYPPDAPVKVYENDVWFSDAWDPLSYGRDVDFSRPFLEQVRDLFREVPIFALSVIYGANSEYANNFTGFKNCYLVFHGNYAEDCMYGSGVNYSKNCIDNIEIDKCENCYGNFFVEESANIVASVQCSGSFNLYFCKSCTGCNDCIGCVNLRNKRYHIFNQPYSREEYQRRLAEFSFGSHASFMKVAREAQAFWVRFPVRYLQGIKNMNVSGEYIYSSKNARDCYVVTNAENVRYCSFIQIGPAKDCYDYTVWGDKAELVYESLAVGLGVHNVKFCVECWPEVFNAEYSLYCSSSSHILGCVSVRNKKFCILNKQYTEGEYHKLAAKIRRHMVDMPYIDKQRQTYGYGEFFPPSFSPMYYNHTPAHEHFPLTKTQAIGRGYRWKEGEGRSYVPTKTPAELPDHINEVPDDITREIILCAAWEKNQEQAMQHNCTMAFRIQPQELAFYRRFNLPLPRQCPNSRHFDRLRWRNSIGLYHRLCQCNSSVSSNSDKSIAYSNATQHAHGLNPCPNEFETSYAPERPEIIYCESCYQSEVA